jgi:PQQ-dependent dehydrogenase (methanol/ethanol family)
MKQLFLAAVFTVATVSSHAQSGKDWRTYGGDDANTRYSVLSQITTTTVSKLKIAWLRSLGTLESQQSTPIVVGDTMYVTSSSGPRYVFALDARNGSIKWQYQPELPSDYAQSACCGVGHRGVAFANGRVFVSRLDARLVALDAATGKELWSKSVGDYKMGHSITSPPMAIKNLVITGHASSKHGVRGALQAYDQQTGELVWKTYTVPRPGDTALETWKGESWRTGGGAPWYVGSYDAQLDLLYWSTGNANFSERPTASDRGDTAAHTNLYTTSQLALDPDDGAVVWHYQMTPSNVWGYEGVNEAVLADLPAGGEVGKLPALMKADANGFFYVLGRNDGRLVSATPFVPLNWSKGVDKTSGRPIENPEKRPQPDKAAKNVCPNALGAKNWQPMSFSPQTGLVYIPSLNLCMDIAGKGGKSQAGKPRLATHADVAVPGPGKHLGELIAWDPVAQRRAWSVPEDLPFVGGALSTAGGLVFYGNARGILKALDARSGDELWRFSIGTGISQSPVTYMVDGKQYLALVAGRIKGPTAFLGKIGQQVLDASPEGGVVAVFELVQ